MPVLDPESVFVIAEQFRSASKWLIHAPGMGYAADVGIPTVSCAAMALELYLKCLNRDGGNGKSRSFMICDTFLRS